MGGLGKNPKRRQPLDDAAGVARTLTVVGLPVRDLQSHAMSLSCAFVL